MHTALQQPRALGLEVPHTLLVVLTTVVVVLLVTALLVAAGLLVQNLAGGAPLVPMQPEAGLDL